MPSAGLARPEAIGQPPGADEAKANVAEALEWRRAQGALAEPGRVPVRPATVPGSRAGSQAEEGWSAGRARKTGRASRRMPKRARALAAR
jgi:hypothetical protein